MGAARDCDRGGGSTHGDRSVNLRRHTPRRRPPRGHTISDHAGHNNPGNNNDLATTIGGDSATACTTTADEFDNHDDNAAHVRRPKRVSSEGWHMQ